VNIVIGGVYGCLQHPKDQGSKVLQKADSYIRKSTLLIPEDAFIILVQL